MNVRITDQKGTDGVPSPVTGTSGHDFQGDNQGKHVELTEEHDQEPVVDLLTDPGPEDELDEEEDVGRDGEQVGFEGVEAEGAEVERQVLRDLLLRNAPGQAEDVDGPEIDVGQGCPEERGCQALSVVHTSLGRIIPQNPVDHDDLLTLGKPAVLPSKPTRRLCRARRQVKPRKNTDQDGHRPLQSKHPSPTSPCRHVSQVQDAKSQEGADDEGADVAAPEETQPDR